MEIFLTRWGICSSAGRTQMLGCNQFIHNWIEGIILNVDLMTDKFSQFFLYNFAIRYKTFDNVEEKDVWLAVHVTHRYLRWNYFTHCILPYSWRICPMCPDLNMYVCTHRSITSTRCPTKIPAASNTKIGATVTKRTTITDDCVSGCGEVMYCWRILALTPLSRSWANLYRKSVCVKS